MRLEDHMSLAKATLPGGSKRGTNLRGMMAIIVDDADSGNLAPQLEAAVDAVEGFECRANLAANPSSTTSRSAP